MINELKALVLTASDDLRQELRCLTAKALVKRCASFRDSPQRPIAERCSRNTMRSIARRIGHLTDEIAVHDDAMKQLVDEAAPQLVAEPGIGYVTAAMFYIAWSHPGRCRNEVAFARLAGVAPLPGRRANARTVTDSTAAVTDNSTALSASSRSPEHAPIRPPAATATGGALKARSTGKSDAASSATSLAESGASSSTLPAPKSPLDNHRRVGVGPIGRA